MVQKRVNLAYKTSEDFTIDEIRKKLGVEKDLYPAYQSLNLRVLKPAVNEVNGISDVDCLFEPILEGRKTVGLRLSWQKKNADQTIKKAKRADLKLVEQKSPAPPPAKAGKRLRELDTRECEQLKKTFFGYDIYYLYSDFQDWIERTGKEVPDNPPAAFTNWLKRCYNIAGPRMA
jgi:plasmid replication initiation protein